MQYHAFEIHSNSKQDGFALITVLLMMTVLMAVMTGYAALTQNERISDRQSSNSTTGFYSAEAGLNIRAEEIRQRFVGYNRPSGTSPDPEDNPCIDASNIGSDDFQCSSYSMGGHDSKVYIEEEPSNPVILTIPPGERYQYLNAQEYRYTAYSTARNPEGRVEAILELHFKSRLVPLFQFAAFYNKDLEILPGPTMTLAGPVHTNGDLYLNTDAGSPGLTINGQVTTAGTLYRGRKNQNLCNSNPVRIYNPTVATSLVPSCSSRVTITPAMITSYNNMIQMDVVPVSVPEPEEFDPTTGKTYWDKADLRLVLHLDNSNNPVTTYAATGIEVRNSDHSVDTTATTALYSSASCAGRVRRAPNAATPDNTQRAVGTSYAFRNNREGKVIRMLDIDALALMNCLKATNWFGTGKLLSDNTEGGLVFFVTVSGPESTSTANRYGFRVSNSARLYSNLSGAPTIKGLSIISDQAAYIQGNFNSTNKIPAAVMADSMNVLSNAWWNTTTQRFNDGNSSSSITAATATTVNSAFLAGTDTTGNTEGAGGQGGAYNGGLENYPRFHENWSGIGFTYTGSFVSLNRPRHVSGGWVYGSPYYTAPNRVWAYDVSFNNAANLPPITPRFVYLRQELFVRQYEEGAS